VIPPGLEKFKPIDRWLLLRQAIKAAKNPGDYAEFGVYKGKSAKQILTSMPKDRTLWLFDSFLGLPEDWNWEEDKVIEKGHFTTQGEPPRIFDRRVRIVKGWFKDTVAEWAQRRKPLSFVHIDSDLYSSCKTVLDAISHLLVPGTVIQFDEIQGYGNSEHDEYKAWMETGLDFEWLGRSERFRAAVRVI
jgi:predicted O-methyltransferase YrrM